MNTTHKASMETQQERMQNNNFQTEYKLNVRKSNTQYNTNKLIKIELILTGSLSRRA